MKNLLRLLRIKHYIKNLLVFLPLIFLGGSININNIINCSIGFVTFSLVSSCIYIINDARDLEKDKLHPTKRNRPMASGAISMGLGILIACFCFIFANVLVLYLIFENSIKIYALLLLLLYFFINLLYSFGLKNFPIIDILILMSGFLIRVLYGAVLADTYVGTWMYLTVMAGAFYFALGKRRNEIKNTSNITTRGKTRKVLASYSYNFLDKFMYVCLAMTCIFYSLWAKEYPKSYMIFTVPLVVIICMQYSLDIEGDSDGDPVEVVLKDKKLLVFCLILVLIMFLILFVL